MLAGAQDIESDNGSKIAGPAADGVLDDGPKSIAPAMQRFCALTRSLQPVSGMIRFVVGPDGDAIPDIKRKLPGRGIWITASRPAIEDAVKRNVFARGFKKQVRVATDLAVSTERLLERAALDALAIAGKAGAVVHGFGKVEDAIGRDKIIGLIQAADAAADGKRKIIAVLRRHSAARPREIAIVDAFTSAQLDLALGRLNVVHAALLAGPASETFLARALRIERFRNGISGDTAHGKAPSEGAGDIERT